MKAYFILISCLLSGISFSQDYYDKARNNFQINEIDSARVYINNALQKNPNAEEYFLSGMIHEAQGKDLRAAADYEAAIQKDPENIEAYFQKGLIYYNSASLDQAIKDFTYVIEHQGSSTKAVYYGNDPFGIKGTYVTTLESIVSRVYQFRGFTYQKSGDFEEAMQDFNTSFEYDTIVDFFINRALLFSKTSRDVAAIQDLREAIELEPESYLAWYNLVILDENTIVPNYLLDDEEFTPMLNLLGANAYEQGKYSLSVEYHSKAIAADPEDDLSYLSRGKSLLRSGDYGSARQDFLKTMQLESNRIEAFYLIGNTFFHEKKFEEAIGFYETYLSIDRSYENVWYNAAMAYLQEGNKERACEYLKNAQLLGMTSAQEQMEKQCDTQ